MKTSVNPQRFFYFQYMKRNLLVSFIVLILMILVMRYMGTPLITPVSPKGIIDVEFARTPERFRQLQLFLDPKQVATNIYLDFLFIAAYTWFLVTACTYIRNRTRWVKWSNVFIGLAIAAAILDACENFLMLLVFQGKFFPAVLQIIFYCALIKFVLAGIVVLFLLGSWPFVLRRKY